MKNWQYNEEHINELFGWGKKKNKVPQYEITGIDGLRGGDTFMLELTIKAKDGKSDYESIYCLLFPDNFFKKAIYTKKDYTPEYLEELKAYDYKRFLDTIQGGISWNIRTAGGYSSDVKPFIKYDGINDGEVSKKIGNYYYLFHDDVVDFIKNKKEVEDAFYDFRKVQIIDIQDEIERRENSRRAAMRRESRESKARDARRRASWSLDRQVERGM